MKIKHLWCDCPDFDPLETERLTSGLPEPLREVIRSALKPEASERCSAGEMRDALRAYLKSLSQKFDKRSMVEEVKRIHWEATKANPMAGRPLERTALVLDDGRRKASP